MRNLVNGNVALNLKKMLELKKLMKSTKNQENSFQTLNAMRLFKKTISNQGNNYFEFHENMLMKEIQSFLLNATVPKIHQKTLDISK
jgi:hypothetical protein